MSVTRSGPVPAELDIRLQRRDRAPLPADALLRLQAISRGKNPAANRRLLVTQSGDIYEAGRSGDTSDWQLPFDQPWSAAPTRTLSLAQVERLMQLLNSRFPGEAPYQVDENVENGTFLVLTARAAGIVYEAIYEAVLTPVASEIVDLLYEAPE